MYIITSFECIWCIKYKILIKIEIIELMIDRHLITSLYIITSKIYRKMMFKLSKMFLRGPLHFVDSYVCIPGLKCLNGIVIPNKLSNTKFQKCTVSFDHSVFLRISAVTSKPIFSKFQVKCHSQPRADYVEFASPYRQLTWWSSLATARAQLDLSTASVSPGGFWQFEIMFVRSVTQNMTARLLLPDDEGKLTSVELMDIRRKKSPRLFHHHGPFLYWEIKLKFLFVFSQKLQGDVFLISQPTADGDS